MEHEEYLRRILAVVKKIHPKPISFLAVLADCEGVISGSNSLEVFCPGYGTMPESDFDIYLPNNPTAVTSVLHALEFTEIKWNSFLLDRFEDVNKDGLTIVPHEMIVELVKKIGPKPKLLERYLKSRLEGVPAWDRFSQAFCVVYKCCFEALKSKSHKLRVTWQTKHAIWVYKSEYFEVVRIPEPLVALIDEAKELRDCRAINGIIPKRQKKITKAWKKAGYPKESLPRYIKYILIRSNIAYNSVQDIINLFLDGTANHEAYDPADYPDDNFQIVRGTLPSGTEVKVMLTEANVLHTILKFYATHLISFIGGTLGAHLYYKSAEQKISFKLDKSKEKLRHTHVQNGLDKYKERGWEFNDARKERQLRSGDDKDVLRVNLKSIYASALREQSSTKAKLPPQLKEYFEQRQQALNRRTWEEKNAQIQCVGYERRYVEDNGTWSLSEWVHEALEGHKDVMSKHDWEGKKDAMAMCLDLWFGGAYENAMCNEATYLGRT
jgi:hypothetical protein